MATAVDSRNQRAPSSSRRDSPALSFLERAFEKELARVARTIRHSYSTQIRSLKSEIAALRTQLAAQGKTLQPAQLGTSEYVHVPITHLSPQFWHSKTRYSPSAQFNTEVRNSPSPIRKSPPSERDVRKSPPSERDVPKSPQLVRSSFPTEATGISQHASPTIPAPTLAMTPQTTTSIPQPEISTSRQTSSTKLSIDQELERYRTALLQSPNFMPKPDDGPHFSLKYRNPTHVNKLAQAIENFVDTGQLPRPVRIIQKTSSKLLICKLSTPSDLELFEKKRQFLERL